MTAPGTHAGLRFRRRDDYAVELFREIHTHLRDLPRVNRALLELGRFYNPVVNGPIVDLPTRRRILELLEAGREDEARQMLDQRLALYAPPDDEAAARGGGTPGENDGGPTDELHRVAPAEPLHGRRGRRRHRPTPP